MRTRGVIQTIILAGAALALTACGKSEVKTGSLVQQYAMVDAEGTRYGVVELDPINGGKIFDSNGRLLGVVAPAAPTTVAAASPVVYQ
jgi:hypothetical protein